MEMVSLPVGGMMTRMAWGSTIRRRVWSLVMPMRLGGFGLALVDRDDPGPHDLGHVGALVEAEAQGGGHERGDEHVGVDGDEAGPEGHAEGQMGIQVADAHVPEDQLDEDRCTPEEPDDRSMPSRTGADWATVA